ncbi:EamA family transporter RarD [Mesobacillus harenae]|uniref:EamA family transporter RarD n=1 Tax=Mesobacillus harenae TaxID=2213203 RepID=UPI0015804250|nr:EamA family transporter RarD [Mesobacillus harenae]
MDTQEQEQRMGIFYAGFAYVLWGFLPIYWKLLNDILAYEILANRVFWSLLFILVFLVLSKKWGVFIQTFRGLAKKPRQLLALTAASLLISTNWFFYIWAVNTNQMVEASLGYYINPLVSVLLGMIFLKERLSKAQYISFVLAGIGVLILTISYGKFPWIAVTLAASFGLYGLAKKLIRVDSAIGLALETMVVMPIAIGYMAFLFYKGTNSFMSLSITTDLLLIGAGAATAVPLLYFSKGAQRIPLSMLGFLQYIAPTIMLILGIFVFHESFSKLHLLSFTFIWGALTLYSLSRTKLATGWHLKRKKGLEM